MGVILHLQVSVLLCLIPEFQQTKDRDCHPGHRSPHLVWYRLRMMAGVCRRLLQPPRLSKGGSAHLGRVSISTINPKEFRPVDGWPDKKPCIVCGRKPTQYQERTKGKTQPGTLCKACYHRAVTMQSSQFRTIPGIIDVTRLQRWTGT